MMPHRTVTQSNFMSNTVLTLIPAGRPPLCLPTAPPEVAEPPSALSEEVEGGEELLPSHKGGGVPSDEVILAWATEVRKQFKGGTLALQGLRFWVKYTFDPFTPEFKQVGERLDALFPREAKAEAERASKYVRKPKATL